MKKLTDVEGLVEIGRLVLAFAKVNRVTMHEDGIRYESDTDHTVMLSVCACALASKLYAQTLDVGKVAQFAIVHDLVEVYSLDTDTFGISEEDKKNKDARERDAYLKIKDMFSSVYPWIHETIEAYESQESMESRFVKTVDKMMTQITHIFNGGAYFKERGIDESSMLRDYNSVIENGERMYGKDFPELISLMKVLVEEARHSTYSV